MGAEQMGGFPLSADVLARITATYALGETQSWKRLPGGTTQANHLLRTSAGDFIVRFYLTRSARYVSFEIDALNQLSAATFPCQQPVPDLQGQFIGEYGKSPFAVFRYINGKHDDSERNHIQVASAVARVHHLSQPMHFTSSVARARYDRQSCLKTAEANLSGHGHDVTAHVSLHWLKKEIAQLELPGRLPIGLCHCDLNPTNFLYNNGALAAVLDFDMAAYTELLYDVANLLYWWANPVMGGKLWLKRAKESILTYEAVRPLTAQEKAHLYDMLKLVFLMSVSWFIHLPDETSSDQKGVDLLNELGRDAFQDQIFG